jgi:hypothetical protein
MHFHDEGDPTKNLEGVFLCIYYLSRVKVGTTNLK